MTAALKHLLYQKTLNPKAMPLKYLLPVIHIPAHFQGLQQTKILQASVVNSLNLFQRN
jgi:hypothetical protein